MVGLARSLKMSINVADPFARLIDHGEIPS